MLAVGAAPTARPTATCVFEMFARRLPTGRRYGVVAGTGRLLDAIESFRFGADELAVLAESGLDADDARLAGRLPVHRRRRRLPRGRAVVPQLAGAHRDRHVRRGRAAGDAGAVDPQPRLRDRLGRGPDGHRGRRPAADRDGLAAHPRGGGGGRRPGRLPRRLLLHLQPGGRPPVRRAHLGHGRARVHAAARRRGGRVPGPGRRARDRHHAAGRHLRHRPRHPDRDRGRRPGAGRDPDRLRRPDRAGPGGPRAARLARRDRHQDRRFPATWTSSRSPACPAPRSTCTAWAPSLVTGSGAPTAGMVYKLVEVDGRPVAKRSSTRRPRRPEDRAAPAPGDRHRHRGGAGLPGPARARPARPAAAGAADARRETGGERRDRPGRGAGSGWPPRCAPYRGRA